MGHRKTPADIQFEKDRKEFMDCMNSGTDTFNEQLRQMRKEIMLKAMLFMFDHKLSATAMLHAEGLITMEEYIQQRRIHKL